MSNEPISHRIFPLFDPELNECVKLQVSLYQDQSKWLISVMIFTTKSNQKIHVSTAMTELAFLANKTYELWVDFFEKQPGCMIDVLRYFEK